jgi:hypothetical protein
VAEIVTYRWGVPRLQQVKPRSLEGKAPMGAIQRLDNACLRGDEAQIEIAGECLIDMWRDKLSQPV